jgi:hypothetical protein
VRKSLGGETNAIRFGRRIFGTIELTEESSGASCDGGVGGGVVTTASFFEFFFVFDFDFDFRWFSSQHFVTEEQNQQDDTITLRLNIFRIFLDNFLW